ncbi:MAG: T9SS type A sorting domain-containing protein [Candidatus Zixiibacteriota bacterium]|nr:MAG: T9SS type A sorting domain-containing protein [candidate division Zixibacteria bacterium]
MFKRIFLPIIILLVAFTGNALSQNQIDYVDSYWWSGYGQPAIDGDTLYINMLNGQGIERYDINDPYNPVFVNRTYATGFDIIDFDRRLIFRVIGSTIHIADFSDFENIIILSTIENDNVIHSENVRVVNNYLYFKPSGGPYRLFSYDISDPGDPIYLGDFQLAGNYGFQIGSTVAVTLYNEYYYETWIEYIYDITRPDSIILTDSTYLSAGTFDGYELYSANGDTIGQFFHSWYFPYESIDLIQFSPLDSAILIEHYYLWGSWGLLYKNSKSSYFINDTLYSFNNLEKLGKIDWADPFSFETYNDQYVVYTEPIRLKYYEATNDTTYMPLIGQYTPEYSYILSSYIYTDNLTGNNYLLTGAESYGGNLIVNEIDNSGNINTVTIVPFLPAQEIIFDSVFALCLCQSNIVALLMDDPSSPDTIFQLGGFNGSLVDFDKRDSLLNVITDRAYYIIDFDYLSGFNILSTLNFPVNSLTSVAQARFSRSYILKGDIGIIDVIDVSDPLNPYILLEKRLQFPVYDNMEEFDNSLWVSCEFGTDVLTTSTGEPDSITFFGPEYFSDVRQIYISHDSMFVADGINGIKVFTFSGHPYSGLEYKGSYRTGNSVSHVATWGDNFYVSDYYALWHLRWGEPTGVVGDEISETPDEFQLLQNYPNPFNASTTIRFGLPTEGKTTIQIFDILGRVVRSFEIGEGIGEITWDGADAHGKPASSGVYFYGITDRPSMVRKMVLLR